MTEQNAESVWLVTLPVIANVRAKDVEEAIAMMCVAIETGTEFTVYEGEDPWFLRSDVSINDTESYWTPSAGLLANYRRARTQVDSPKSEES